MKKVLYVATLPTYLPTMLIHRMTVNRDADAVLFMCSDAMYGSDYKWTVVVKHEIFSKVFFIQKNIGEAEANVSEQAVEKAIEAYYEEFIHINKIALADFDQIIVTNDVEGAFTAYLAMHKIHSFWIEIVQDAAKLLHMFQYDLMDKIMGKFYGMVMRKYNAMSAYGAYSTPILFESSAESREFHKDKPCEFWNKISSIETISDADINKLLECFSFYPDVLKKSNATLLLGQSPAWPMKSINSTYTRLLYSDLTQNRVHYCNLIALDYYLSPESPVIIKLHPHTALSLEKIPAIYGPNAETIGAVPFDFLSSYLIRNTIKVDSVLSFSSSSNAYLNGTSENIVLLGIDYWYAYRFYHALYTTLTFFLKYCPKYTLICDWPLVTQATLLAKHALGTDIAASDAANIKKIDKQTFALICNTKRADLSALVKSAAPDALVCFLNTDPPFYDESLAEFFIPIRINKFKKNDKTLDPCQNEIVFFFTRDAKMRNRIREFTLKKELPRLGISISVSKLSVPEIIAIQKEAVYFNTTRKTEQIDKQIRNIETRMQIISKENRDLRETIAKIENAFSEVKEWKMAELKWYMGDNADRVNASLDELKRWYADDNVGRVNASLDELKRWYADDNVGRFYKRLDQLETEMRKRETRTEERITQALGEIKELYRGLLMSRSWRIGRAITWLPRKIKDLFRHT